MSQSRLTCADACGHLPLFVGGDLEGPLIEGVEEHLQGCSACRAELERARAARAVLLERGLSGELPEADLWPALRERLLDSPEITVHARPQRRSAGFGGAWWRRSAGLAAAAAVLVAVGLWAGGGTGELPGSAPAVASDGTALPASPSPLGEGGAATAQSETQPVPVASPLQRVTAGDELLLERARPFGEFPQSTPIFVSPQQRSKNVLAGELR